MSYIEYTTKLGDRFDLIAWRFYGDPLLYETIIEANKESLWVFRHADGSTDWQFGGGAPDKVWFGNILGPLPEGLVLYVPELEIPVTPTIRPPWMV
jgi:nucleoid-associated protein YgaU